MESTLSCIEEMHVFQLGGPKTYVSFLATQHIKYFIHFYEVLNFICKTVTGFPVKLRFLVFLVNVWTFSLS